MREEWLHQALKCSTLQLPYPLPSTVSHPVFLQSSVGAGKAANLPCCLSTPVKQAWVQPLPATSMALGGCEMVAGGSNELLKMNWDLASE